MDANEVTESHRFKAEITQLLNILVHSLYKEREIFLRELVSNASDALTRLQFEMLTNRKVLDPDSELAIHISVIDEGDQKEIRISDSGVGMTKAELIQNLGTIAQSGAREFLEKIEENEVDVSEIIGQFGVGFYSVFMVADKVRVISRSFKPQAKAVAWESDGGNEFNIESSEKKERGTEIQIFLKKDADEFANEWRLRQIIKKYSDFVSYPIYIGTEQANQQLPLWRKSPSEVTAEEYRQFYQQLTMDFAEPLVSSHISSDSPLHLRALLYIPEKREPNTLNLRQQPGVQLYSHNILIEDYSQDLLPNWLDYVDGVVESEDIPLNVSRESIQNTRIIRQLAKIVRKRILREIGSKAEDYDDYALFWKEYSRSIKEGVAAEPDSRDELAPLLRYYSSKSQGKLTSLDAYIESMEDGQTEIYYVSGDDLESVRFSPHLDPFQLRDLEVLYFLDPIDVFIAPQLNGYKEFPFTNIANPNLELPASKDKPDETEADNQVELTNEPDFNRLVGRFVTTLGERVLEVRESKLLRESPIRLVSSEEDPNSDMQRLMRQLNKDYEIPKKILEINRSHPIMNDLSELVREKPDDELINISIEQLYENALVQEGLHPNPAAMLPRVIQLIELATHRSINDRSS
jgi:molecular chaperone HtpG